jgi:hypothetical protein
MKMIPDYLLHSKSGAERRVFDKLRDSFNGEGWYAFHSLNLPCHQTKRFGEVDFVVCGPDGLFVLEIKGGCISCKNGEWGTTGANNRYTPLKEAPHTQAEGALHGLSNKVGDTLRRRFVCGYGVITPDCSMAGIDSAEWDRKIWADSRNLRDFEKWFKLFTKHWREVAARQYKPTPASKDEIKEMVKHLRPDFDTATPLFDRVALAEDRIAVLTEDQLRFVDIIEENPRVICEGGAGTGKTFLAVELAKRWAAADMKVALTCYSPWLKRYIESFAMPEVTVSQFDTLEVAARRAGTQRFDALIIDEGQDLLNIDSLEKMDTLLVGGLESGRWCLFHDSNNQAGVLGDFDTEALTYLRELRPVSVPLKTNCRNTSQILKKIQTTLSVDMGNDSVGNGPEVFEVYVAEEEMTSNVLKREIKHLLRDGDFTVNEITVLSPYVFRDSGAFDLRSDARIRVNEMDSFSPGSSRSSIGFATIPDFKGLESEVVFLVDMPSPGSDADLRKFQYIGMSRARALLYLVIDDKRKRVKI